MKSFVGVTVVQSLEFSFVVQEVDVFGAPKTDQVFKDFLLWAILG